MEDEKFKMLLEAAPEAIVIVDKTGKIKLANSQSEKYFGYRREELIGQRVEVLVPDELQKIHAEHRKKYIAHPFKRPMGIGLNLRAKHKDGRTFPVEIALSPLGTGGDLLVTAIVHDVTEHKQIEERLKHLAEHDALTGLVNRVILEDRIELAITLAKRHHYNLAVFFLDLDGFKKVNDTYGHAIGDRVLRAVTKRIQGCIRGSDTLARVGGDEFALLILEIKTEDAVTQLAKKILRRFTKAFLINNKKIVTTLSMGISLYPKDGADHQSLLKKADAAMYEVKNHGKNGFKIFGEEIQH